MKIFNTILLAVLMLSAATLTAQDTMYVHFTATGGGDSIVAHAIADIDSVVYYAPEFAGTSGTFVDSRDNTEYEWVKINNQIWMAEYLKYLPQVDNNNTFKNAKDARYGVYNYDGTDVSVAKASTNYSTYGAMYNWYAAMNMAASSNSNPSAVQGVCPSGWHLPSYAEWTDLTDYVSISHSGTEGAALKATSGWSSGNGTDNYGFNTVPGGYRHATAGSFAYLTQYSRIWTSTESDSDNAYYIRLNHDTSALLVVNVSKSIGFYIRCVKD